MFKTSPLLSLAVVCLALNACTPSGPDSQRSDVQNVSAPKPLPEADGDIAVADIVLKLPSIDASNLSASLQKAEQDFIAGNYVGGASTENGALETYLAVLKFQPENSTAQLGLKNTMDILASFARQKMQTGNLASSRRLLDVIGSSEYPLPDLNTLNQEWQAAQRAGEWVEKAQAFEASNKVIPTDTENKNDNAVSAYRAAMNVFPGYQPAIMAIDRLRTQREIAAMQLAGKNKFEAAFIALKKAEQVDAKHPQFQATSVKINGLLNQRIRHEMVLAHLALDGLRVEQAQTFYQKAKKIYPLHPELPALEKRIDEVKHYGRFKPGQGFSDAWAMSSPAPEMVVMPYGQFEMGVHESLATKFPAESPRYTVTFVRGFAMAKTEITVGQFRQFIESSGYITRATQRGLSTVFDEKGGSMINRDGVDWRYDHLGRLAKEDLPVVHVNLVDAMAYATWLSEKTGMPYRIPSEAEFEYALRAGNDWTYPWGNESPKKAVANLAGAGDKSSQSRSWGNAIEAYKDFHWGAAPVASFPREAWGSFDLGGNVEEWVQDCWHDTYARAPTDGTAWVNPGCNMGVTRGASWASSLEEARVSFRAPVLMKTHNAQIGFRVVRGL